MNRFSMIGAGRVGLHLCQALQNSGFRLRHIYKKSLNDRYRKYFTTDLARLVSDSDFVFLCVQESKIKPLAALIRGAAMPAGKVFFHTANSLTSDELQPLRLAGAAVASFSPLQAFIDFNRHEELFSGITFLLEGDPAAVRLARSIAARLHAKVLPVRRQDKMYFHMAAIATANFLNANLKFAERQLQKTANRPAWTILLPLLEQTLRNIKKHGWESSLSGPLRRGEPGLLEKHARLLAGSEKKIYRLLLRYLQEDSAG